MSESGIRSLEKLVNNTESTNAASKKRGPICTYNAAIIANSFNKVKIVAGLQII